jgi:hypothetical protein
MAKAQGDETVSQAREPYAIVNECNRYGEFMVTAVYPNKHGDHFSIYEIALRTVDGVLDGCIHPRATDAHSWKKVTHQGNYASQLLLPKLSYCSLIHLVARTKKLPPGAIPVVRWWQQHRRPGPQRCEDLVMLLLNKEELARIAAYTNSKADEFWCDGAEADVEALQEHRKKFITHYISNDTVTNLVLKCSRT